MKRLLLSIVALTAGIINVSAIDKNTVQIVYSGNYATITIASNISSYVTVKSGNSSHVVIVQDPNFAGVDKTVANINGEIYYNLSGTSSDGEFYMEGAYKSTVVLTGLTLTNPSGPAINVQNGKRIDFTVKSGTTNTLTDGVNDLYKGCYHCKGHTKMKGKGTLNIVANNRHGIYCKEYFEIKNATLNITKAAKDGIHCQQYFSQESGNVTISNVQDDGIQVELDGTVSTGITTDHEDEDTGNFYMTGGSLTIQNYGDKAIKADGTVSLKAGTQTFSTSDVLEYAGIEDIIVNNDSSSTIYDLNGRRLNRNGSRPKGIYLIKENGVTRKVINR